MKVILTKKVPALGNIGEMVNVSVGHARNYLFPNSFAVLADDKNKKALENQKRSLAKKINAEKSEASTLKAKIDGIQLEFVKRVGPNGKLFGSITSNDLSDELGKKGLEVERRLIQITNPIKSLGNFSVKVKLFMDVEAKFQVKVVIDPEQAEEIKAQQAAAEKRKKEAALAAKEAAENAPTDAVAQEIDEDERLKRETNALLRG
jgi:large subunit ribosomal protein L9